MSESVRVLGVDLGQLADFTAITVVDTEATSYPMDVIGRDPVMGLPIDETRDVAGPPFTSLVRHLQRLPLGTSYVVVVQTVATLLERLPGALLVVDATGVGQGVLDMFEHAGLQPYAVTITAGDTVSGEGRRLRCPKRDLVAVLQTAFQAKRLLIARELPEAETLVRELGNFKVKLTASANDVYGSWREGQHDDLVLSAALSVWLAEQILAGLGREQQAAVTAAQFNEDVRVHIGPGF